MISVVFPSDFRYNLSFLSILFKFEEREPNILEDPATEEAEDEEIEEKQSVVSLPTYLTMASVAVD